jgi:hypothetical protein
MIVEYDYKNKQNIFLVDKTFSIHETGSSFGRPNRRFEENFVRFIRYKAQNTEGLALQRNGEARGLLATEPGYPGNLDMLIGSGLLALEKAAKTLSSAPEIDLTSLDRLPPVSSPEKVICVGLNFRDHSAESGFKQPDLSNAV